MPFDSLPQETKTDPLTLEALAEWLEMQPANATYNFALCNGTCLLSQYLGNIGQDPVEGYSKFVDAFKDKNGFDAQDIARAHPQTFGAALQRARERSR